MTEPTIPEIIHNRRSIRKFTNKSIEQEEINKILDAGRWAPSGLNNQPWKFSIVKNQDIKLKLSNFTKYKRIIQECSTCICVFYNIPAGYNRDKDLMSIGACIQNMLLTSEFLGIGSVWLGEILNKKNDVNNLLHISTENELMAVIALGYPNETPVKDRIEINALMLTNFY